MITVSYLEFGDLNFPGIWELGFGTSRATTSEIDNRLRLND